MAVKRPLAIYGDSIEELRTGDTLPGVTGGSGNACTCTVDFGTDDTDASVVVTGQSWVTASSVIVCSVLGEDARIQSITANVDTLVNGVGFTVHAHAPEGASGTFTVNCIGV